MDRSVVPTEGVLLANEGGLADSSETNIDKVELMTCKSSSKSQILLIPFAVRMSFI